ncbi:MAG: hypothetical protein EOO61_14275 [Hymenobacter sp.]|nr:MAG: hypothetical protein EOO61_14275 [Hymenobacter sp.]
MENVIDPENFSPTKSATYNPPLAYFVQSCLLSLRAPLSLQSQTATGPLEIWRVQTLQKNIAFLNSELNSLSSFIRTAKKIFFKPLAKQEKFTLPLHPASTGGGLTTN